MTATWEIKRVPQDEVTAEFLFKVAKRHGLMFDNVERMISYYRGIVEGCIVLEILKDDGDRAAYVIISDVVEGESASVDMILVSKHYAPILPDESKNPVPYNDLTAAALIPVLDRLMDAKQLRRVTATVPKSRSRTFHALEACGFKKEGVMRRAVKFSGKDVEDLVIMGLLPE